MKPFTEQEMIRVAKAYITNPYNGITDVYKPKEAKNKLPTDKYGKGSKWTKPKKKKRK